MKYYIILFFTFFLIQCFSQQKWQKLNGPEGATISALIVKGDTLLAGTGYYKALIFYSTDKGISWQKANYKKARPVGQSRINEFVFTEDGEIMAAAGLDGIFKSYDLINWQNIFNNSNDFWSIGEDNRGQVFVGSEQGKIFHSSDNGLNWILDISGLGRIQNFHNFGNKFYAGASKKVAVKYQDSTNWTVNYFDSLLNPIKVFSDDFGNLYYYTISRMIMSSDSGRNWFNRDVNYFIDGNILYECIFNNRILGGFDDQTGLFGDGWGIALSDDYGMTWRWSNNGFPPQFSSIFKLAKSGTETYAGSSAAGVFKSTDFGDNWSSLNNGLTAANTLGITFDSNENMYAACLSNGIHKSTDKGLTWRVINKGLTNSYLYCIIAADNDILLAGTDRATFRSTDQGENWNKIDDKFFVFFYKDKLNRIYGSTYSNGLYRSSNTGITWSRVDKGFITGSIYGFAIDKDENLYAGTDLGYIYKSTDDGNTWINIYQSGNTNSLIMSMIIAPNGYIYAANLYDGIIRSTDGGITWTRRKADNGYTDRYPLVVSEKGILYAGGSNSKFYSSTDDGNTWIDVTDNLKYTSVQSIIFDKEGKMYLATDESVWTEAPDSTVNISEVITSPKDYSLEQNYPNPFNPVTTIRYSIPVSGQVIIKVFNTLGKEVLVIVNETKSAGSYEVNFDGSLLPSGVYFYRIQTGLFIQTKKMILLK